jgi:hypothetical protein
LLLLHVEQSCSFPIHKLIQPSATRDDIALRLAVHSVVGLCLLAIVLNWRPWLNMMIGAAWAA